MASKHYSGYVSSVINSSKRKRVDINYTTLTKTQVFYLLNHAYGTKQNDESQRPDLSREDMDAIEGNFSMAHEICLHYGTMEGSVINSVTPLNWDEQKEKISANIKSTVTKVKIGEEEKSIPVELVTLDKKTYMVPRVNGIPQIGNLEQSGIVNTLPVSPQAANVAIAAGNLTERTNKNDVKLAIGVDAMKLLKIPFLSEINLVAFCNKLKVLVKDMPASTNGVSGLTWANQVYNHLVAMPVDQCFFVSTNLIASIFSSNAKFVRPLSKTEIAKITKFSPDCDADEFRVQHSLASATTVVTNIQMTMQSTYTGCIDSRNFRKTDGKGMSGANQGCYTGEFITKSTRNLRNKLTMLSAFEMDPEIELIIYTEDVDLMRRLPQIFDKQGKCPRSKWSVVTKTRMAIPNVTKVTTMRTLVGKAVFFFPEAALPNLIPSKGFEPLIQQQQEETFNEVQHILNLDPVVAFFPCKVLDFNWVVPNSATHKNMNCVGPSPHNLEYYKVVQKLTDDKKKEPIVSVRFTTELTEATYALSCNIANSYRNTWFMHRIPLEDLFHAAKVPYVPTVRFIAPPPLKEVTPNQLLAALADGATFSDQDILDAYMSLSSGMNEAASSQSGDEEEEDVSESESEDDGDILPKGVRAVHKDINSLDEHLQAVERKQIVFNRIKGYDENAMKIDDDRPLNKKKKRDKKKDGVSEDADGEALMDTAKLFAGLDGAK